MDTRRTLDKLMQKITCSWDATALMGTALAAAEVKEVILFARGAAALAAAAAAMERRWATISAGDRDLSRLLSS